jgi:hypothetical protein
MPAYGWLQRVRHNTYTVCYRVLVADHHLLVDHPSPRPAHLIRTVILHNSKHSFPRKPQDLRWPSCCWLAAAFSNCFFRTALNESILLLLAAAGLLLLRAAGCGLRDARCALLLLCRPRPRVALS